MCLDEHLCTHVHNYVYMCASTNHSNKHINANMDKVEYTDTYTHCMHCLPMFVLLLLPPLPPSYPALSDISSETPLKLHAVADDGEHAPYDKEMANSETDLLGVVPQSPPSRLTKWCRAVDWRQVRANARAYLNLLLILAIVYLTLFCILGEITLPALYLVLIWQAAHLGGFMFDLVRFPSILGMMFVGFMLRNFMGPVLDPLP